MIPATAGRPAGRAVVVHGGPVGCVPRYGGRRGSGGTGEWPGGDGAVRELEVLDDCTVSLITERRLSRPWGLDGGGPGAAGVNRGTGP